MLKIEHTDILVADEETLAAESSGYDRPERVQASWPIDRVDQTEKHIKDEWT